jgi:lipoprotein-releasing system permease protein
MMKNLYLPLMIGLRYNRSSNRQQFLSLLSWVSLLGMVLGVAALIIVLSVMNGFQGELRDRMLALIAHGQIEAKNEAPIDQWRDIEKALLAFPEIVAAAPLVGGDVMLSSGRALRAVELQGVDIEKEQTIAQIQHHIVSGDMSVFATKRYPIILGRALANGLGLTVGERVAVVLPKMTITPLGPRPRIKQFTIVALFEVGGEMDATSAYIPLKDAQKLYSMGDKVHAIRYLTHDVLAADSISPKIQHYINAQADNLQVVAWTQKRQQLFSAIKMEKMMVMFMLSMVVAVAAFNLISILSMMVSEKRSEIAVLRMMGLSPKSVLLVFLTQGLSLAMVGLLLGGILGILAALNMSALIHFLENLFGFYIFDPNVFYVSGLPSVLMWQDVIYVFGLSFTLSVLFTIYPAYQASKVKAVEALQYQ